MFLNIGFRKSSRSIVLGLAAIVASAGTVQAQNARTVNLAASGDLQQDSSFKLNFTDLGIETSSRIIQTRFNLVINEETGTAHFESYDQDVEPLILPGPTADGISTGALTIRLVPGSSSGFYNPATKIFTTSEQYEINFAGDLNAFGLTSPVVLPSSTVGTVKGGVATAARIDMNWSGVGQLANPSAPTQPLRFNYTCKVNTVVAQPDPAEAISRFSASVCGGGTAAMVPLMATGLLLLGTRRRVMRPRP